MHTLLLRFMTKKRHICVKLKCPWISFNQIICVAFYNSLIEMAICQWQIIFGSVTETHFDSRWTQNPFYKTIPINKKSKHWNHLRNRPKLRNLFTAFEATNARKSDIISHDENMKNFKKFNNSIAVIGFAHQLLYWTLFA